MKIVINTINLLHGGAFQRSVNFIKCLKEHVGDEYVIFHTEKLDREIDITSFPNNCKFVSFDSSPASLRTRKSIVKKMHLFVKQEAPDVVFSFFGPAYFKPVGVPHLVGFAIPHIVYPEYFNPIGIKERLEMWYKSYWTIREASHYVVETADVKIRLSKILRIRSEKVYVVSNSYGNQYEGSFGPKKDNGKRKKLLLLSTYRTSKNFEIIKEIIPLFVERRLDIEFQITINEDDYSRVFGDKWTDRIINHGHVDMYRCPELYQECDAMFLPTHLECFSASYPEAMKMGTPILTSDRSFARDVCGKAALYFDNKNPVDIVNNVEKLFDNTELYDTLVNEGYKRLERFDSVEQQTDKYLEICRLICVDK